MQKGGPLFKSLRYLLFIEHIQSCHFFTVFRTKMENQKWQFRTKKTKTMAQNLTLIYEQW